MSRYDGEIGHSLICVCDEGYTGEHCDQCAPGYFGNPHEKGGSCIQCECNGRIDTNDPDACNASTGVCEKCLYNRASPDCVECADGYYEEDGECVPCLCDGRGSTDAVCDKQSGQCPCVAHVTGRTCNSCITNFYDLINANEAGGCKACACDPHNSVNPATACDEYTGQCDCKPGFGGRDCSTCQNGHWGDPAQGDCKSCDCDPLGTDPNAENECDPFTGQCACIEGVGELQCDKCARGYHGDVPECEPCGECFDSWDNIIQELIGETTEVLAQVNTIQEKGVSVVYDSQFDKIEQFLNRARAILESEEGMILLQKMMTSIESKNQNGRTRLDDIYGSLDEINQTNGEQQEQLAQMQRAIKQYAAELASLKKSLDDVADKDPVVMWSRISEMANDAIKFEILAKKAVGFYNNPDDNPLAESARIRSEVEEAIPLRQTEFEDASRELGNMIDDTEGLNDLVIGEINELVCGVNTEGCDPTCGGAECMVNGREHCGNPDYSVAGEGQMCQSSGYQTANRAQAHAYDAEELVQKMRDQVNKALDDTEPIRIQSKEANDKAVKVNDQAKQISGKIADYHSKISELVNDIRDFLKKDEHTDPANILDIAQQVLNLQMPPQSEIDELKAKMAQLGMDSNTDSDDEDTTGANFAELTRIQAEASDVLKRARELAEKVDSALKHYRGAESDCKTAKELNAKASTNADIADELHEQIVGSVHKLQGLVEKLRELVTKEDGISEKVKKINRKITAIQGNERNSTVLHEQANEKYNEVKAEYDAEKEKPTFDMGRQFTEKVEDLRETQNKAFRLQDNVKALMEEVKNYKKEWEDLQKRHREIKAQVDDKKNLLNEIKNEAKTARNAIHKKLYKTEACPSTGNN